MSKIFNVYENNLDRTWYESSNVLYSECDDKNNDLKTLRIVFKNGRTYEYYNVDVHDYMLFRENKSQGQALNKYILKYEVKKIDDTNLDKLQEMLEYYQNVNNEQYPYVKVMGDIVNVNISDNVVNTFKLSECQDKLDTLKKLLEVLKIKINVDV